MKPIGEEQQEVASALNDRAVVDYLLQHPEFFIRNAAQVEHLRVPHPVRGTISLVEWHMMRARRCSTWAALRIKNSGCCTR